MIPVSTAYTRQSGLLFQKKVKPLMAMYFISSEMSTSIYTSSSSLPRNRPKINLCTLVMYCPWYQPNISLFLRMSEALYSSVLFLTFLKAHAAAQCVFNHEQIYKRMLLFLSDFIFTKRYNFL